MSDTDAAIRRLQTNFGNGLDREVLESVLAVCEGNVQEAINFLQAQGNQPVWNPNQHNDGIPQDYPPLNRNNYQGYVSEAPKEGTPDALEAELKNLFLKEGTLEQHYRYQTEQYPEYAAVLLLLLNQGVEITKGARTRLLAALWARRDYELADYLLDKHTDLFHLPQVVGALQMLDSGRRIRAFEKRIHRLQQQGAKARKVGALRSQMNDLQREAQIGSVSGALAKRVKRWVRTIPESNLSFYALTLPKEPWRELADILHLNPAKDFACSWFLSAVFEEEAGPDSILTKVQGLNVNNVVPLATEYKIPYSFLRLRIKPLPDDAKVAVAKYEKIETVIWWHEELACPEVNEVISQRLDAGELPKFAYGKLMERMLYLRSINAPFYAKMIPAAEGILENLDLTLESPVVVLGDASYSMDVAIRCSTIIGSVLSILSDADLRFFNTESFPPAKIPKTVDQVLEVASETRADGLTAPACTILDYYRRKEVVKFFIVVTDEIENVKSEDFYFPTIFQRYYREVYPARLVFVSFLENPSEKGRMVRALEAMGIEPLQFRLDGNRPDLTKFDSLLGLLASEGTNFSTQMRVLASTLQEKGIKAVINQLTQKRRTKKANAENIASRADKPALVAPKGSEAEEVDDDEGNVCVICEERPITHCLLECGHLSFCDRCAPQMVGKECPLCRKPVARAVRIFSELVK